MLEKRLPVDVLGIEPAEAKSIFEQNGIPAIDSFFCTGQRPQRKIARKGQK